jgi:hypothetical protein
MPNCDYVAIAQSVKMVESKLRKENDFKQAIEKIERTLTNQRGKNN